MDKKYKGKGVELQAIVVHQWLAEWNKVKWDPEKRRSRPAHWYYLFSIPASDLKRLSGIYPRSVEARERGKEDLGIQRRHDPERSDEIRRFVQYGYPLSDPNKTKLDSQSDDLRMPGWLSTAIVINILKEGDVRGKSTVREEDLVKVVDSKNGKMATITLPQGFEEGWDYESIAPIEVIDGQHRLWAFEDRLDGDFEFPVVAFVGLDISWQAYLFYTINIKPKPINPSLAFDLYPLLRTEEWLTRVEGHRIYRETRAQELVDMLWAYPESPWYKRINMLGETGFRGKQVSQGRLG